MKRLDWIVEELLYDTGFVGTFTAGYILCLRGPNLYTLCLLIVGYLLLRRGRP